MIFVVSECANPPCGSLNHSTYGVSRSWIWLVISGIVHAGKI